MFSYRCLARGENFPWQRYIPSPKLIETTKYRDTYASLHAGQVSLPAVLQNIRNQPEWTSVLQEGEGGLRKT